MPTNTPPVEAIRIVKAALDESESGDIILRGVVDPRSLAHLKVDDYQREVLPLRSLAKIIEAYKTGKSVPDITLGMRGGAFDEKSGVVTLTDPTYVIDGLQRISAAIHCIQTGQQLAPHVGAMIHFNTDRESELDLFNILNTQQNKLSPNVMIRNLRDTNTTVDMLFNLSHERQFVLYDRVSWAQRPRRHELLTAQTMLRITGNLHACFGPGLSSSYMEAARAIEKTMRDVVTRTIMKDNLKTFFEVIDMAWGIRSVAFKEGAVYLKSGFLLALAATFSRYTNFWDDNRHLKVDPDLRRKLASFPIHDPMVRTLCGSTSKSSRLEISRMITNHLNSGKRTKRLVPFKNADEIPPEDTEKEEEHSAA